MIDGTVFGKIDDADTIRPMEIRQGASLAPFEPCTENPINLFEVVEEYRLETHHLVSQSRSEPPEDMPGDIYACWINHLHDWTLKGADTIQLMINQHDAPCTVVLDTPLHVPTVEDDMFVEVYLGAHRAHATLVIQLRDPDTEQARLFRNRFDTSFAGGINRTGYAHIRHPIPTQFNTCEITFRIEYEGRQHDENGIEPYLFLADIRATKLRETGMAEHVLEPEWLYGHSPEGRGTWMSAPLPAVLAPGQDIDVTVGDTSIPLTPMCKPDFMVRENYGHTLVCTSSEEMDLVLCIDGENIEQVRIKRNDTIIRLPNRYLNGHVRHLSLKDKSGSVVVFEAHQLMPAIVTPEDVMRRESVAPFPTTLFAQTPMRYASLKAALTHAKPGTDLPQLAHALTILEGGHENVRLKPLRFPVVMNPDVSIVIPAHNKVEVTYLALCSLLLAHNNASFEVIVVDDATATLDQLVEGITVIHNTTAQRFVRACNTGADAARGTYITLLNNDVEVTTGWLDALVDAFTRFDNVGMAGSKLLYPNGDLQDAGGIIWGSGNPWNYGNRQNPNEPRFSYARQADYLSGAALMMRTDLWRELGGLSAAMEPMYFEDTDLAFKVREAGYTTWFVPSSIVYHYEGLTSGTDVTSGFKKYQEINRPKFKRRWAAAYAGHGTEGHQPDMEKDRGIVGRVLFMDYAPPRADKDAGSYAALQEMKLVQSLGYKVTFVSTNMAHLGSYTETLQKMGVEVIYAPFYMNVTEYLTQHAADFDAFYITRYYVAQAVLSSIRALAPNAKIIFNNADLHFLRELRAAKSEGDQGKLDRARQTRTEEIDVINTVDVVLSYTDIEHSVIQAYTDGQASVLKCPWVVDVPNMIPPATDRSGMSFLGSYRHHPNAEGITWFVQNVMPTLATENHNIPLAIYGSGMTDDIRALASDLVTPQGFIENVEDAYHHHRISIAPLLSGAGIKGKVLSALAHGIPCIVSPIAAEGIGLRSGHDCIIAEHPRDWVNAITALHTDDDLWLTISQNARTYMRGSFSFIQGRGKMRAAFEAADMYGSRP
jgi:GT2 family glycosyltransferase